jgi:D-alanyl-D-alanine carboxypeptidase
MLLNRGKGEGRQILSEESFSLMTQPAIASEFHGYDQAYGLLVGQPEQYGGHTIVWTGGEMIGYEAAMIGDMTVGVGVVLFVNSFYVPWQETHFALQVLQAVAQGADLPPLPAPKPPATHVENAAQYAGLYRSQDRTFELVAQGHQLLMHYADARIALERWSPHVFYVPHPDLKLSTLKFGLEDGKVVEAFCGPDWYRNEHYDGPAECDYPAEWDSYVGHYRTYSPWMSNFRAFVCKGQMVLQWFGSYEQPLTALDDGAFRVGWATHSPERLRFDCFVHGKALRAVLSGAEYYRVDTP